MSLVNYSKDNSAFASSGACIKVHKDETGSASLIFTGPSGTYDIKTWYFDENDGKSQFSLYVNHHVIDSWKGDAHSCSNVPADCNRKSRVVSGVKISNGWNIKLVGKYGNPGEYARFDCVYFNMAPIVSLPKASPATITSGTTIKLSVSSQDDGKPTDLKFTCRKIAGPGNVVFTPQGTNSAQITSALISSPGTYSFVVDVSDNGFTYLPPLSGSEQSKKSTSVPVSVTVKAGNAAPTIAIAAFCSANPVISTFANLGVLAADDSGEQNLVYTWEALSSPSPVTFSDNATNSAKNTKVTFYQAGNYGFRVTAKDKAGLTAISSVNVLVQQSYVSISISPKKARPPVNTSVQFSASISADQFGNAVSPQPSLSWTSSGGHIYNSGLFEAGASVGGPYQVIASTGTKSDTAIATVVAAGFDALSRIEAEGYSSGPDSLVDEVCPDGTRDISNIHNGNTIVFTNVNFDSGATIFDARVSSASSGGSIELHLDNPNGPAIGVCKVYNTGGHNYYATRSCYVTKTSGIHSLYLTCTGLASDTLFSINWLRFGNITAIAAGGYNSFFIKSDSTLWGIGDNSYGQLGDGTTLSRYSPILIMDNVKSVSPGFTHTLILKTDNTLWACGDNSTGQLGDSTYVDKLRPVEIMSDVKTMMAAWQFSLVVKNDSTLWAFGDDEIGQLGDGGLVSMKETPFQVLTNVSALGKGFSLFGFAITTDSSLMATGYNEKGQLGDGTVNDVYTWEQTGTHFSDAAIGYEHSLQLKSDSTVWSTGNNNNGQLGDGTGVDKSTLVQIASSVIAIATGDYFSVILKSNGTVYGFGDNSFGQLGDGTTVASFIPKQILTDVNQISTGSDHLLMLKNDGTIWGCGLNSNQQLNDGIPDEATKPVMFTLQ